MKKRILIWILTLMATLSCAFAFSACDSKNNSAGGGTSMEQNSGNGNVDKIPEDTTVDASSISLDHTNAALEIGGVLTLTATVLPNDKTDKGVTWSSSDENIATVTNGVVIAKSAGMAVIIAQTQNGKIATCIVTVSPFIFEEYGAGYAVKNYKGAEETVTVPSMYKGKPVVSVGTGLHDGFYNTLVKKVILPSTVTTVNSDAFQNCYFLESVEMPNVVNIASGAFYNCSALQEIVLPESCTSLGYNAFYGCNIKKVTIKNDNFTDDYSLIFEKMEELSFGGKSFKGKNMSDENISKNAKSIIKQIKKLVLLDGVTEIEENACKGWANLESVTIPNTLTSISSSAFSGCTSLKGVYITDIAAWCNISFDNASANPLRYAKNLYLNNELVTELIIPNSVASIGDYAFYNCSKLRSVEIGDSVTSIGNHAFYNCSSLASVEIGDSVASIGDDAFYDCRNLKSVEIGDSVASIGFEAFSGCRNLKSVEIGDSVASIGDSAFYDCRNLKSVYITDIAAWCNISFDSADANPLCCAKNLYLNNELVTELIIPDSVTSIGDDAFRNCSSLTSVEIGDSVTSIGNDAFSDCSSLASVEIGDSVASIGNYAFYDCSSLTSVEIGESVTSIGNYAFYDCSSLTSVEIGDSVTSIGIDAFSSCDSLTSVVIGDSVASIGDCAFTYCRNLTSVEIGESVASIGDSAFSYCSSLTSVVIPDSVTSIGDRAFYYCSSLTSVGIGDSVTSIGNYAFDNCSSLTSVEIGDSVTSIGDSAFYDCSSLTSVYITDIAAWCNISFDSADANPLYYAKNLYLNNELVTELIIPDSVTSIGDYAFSSCDSLTSVVIGDSVTSIGDDAFYKCSSLTSVVIGNSVTSIGFEAFYNCSSLARVYYKGTASAWTKISIDSYNSELTNNATRYYYSETQPTTTGNYWHYVNGKPTRW